jgi:GR25 family glycosyltransferase involved in LPS biosynthesis
MAIFNLKHSIDSYYTHQPVTAKIDKTYIVHYEKLGERKAYLDSIIENISDNYEYIISNEETDKLLLEKIDRYYKYDPNILEREIKIGELNVSVTHLKIYEDILKNNYKMCLILEDDAVILDSYRKVMDEILNSDIEEYDFIFLSTCCGMVADRIKDSHIQDSLLSKCLTGYLINSKKVKDVIDLSIPISTNLDNHLNDIREKLNLKFGHCEPPIIIQGSETIYKSNLR